LDVVAVSHNIKSPPRDRLLLGVSRNDPELFMKSVAGASHKIPHWRVEFTFTKMYKLNILDNIALQDH
jgi:hypothetical protein